MSLNNPNTQASEAKDSPKTPNANAGIDSTLEQEYVDRRTITISLAQNYSAYRKMNIKILGQRKETIGSSIRSCQIMMSNAEELAAYFPALIGVSSSSPEFITRVSNWLNNIQFVVNDANVDLNTTFIYKRKKDYLDIKKQEDEINDEYDKVDRSDMQVLRKALAKKIDKLNHLEATKYKFGKPENIEHYLMYRHCLNYDDVAKDIAFINGNPSIRFYIKDEQKEKDKLRRMLEQKTKAMKAFVEISGTDNKFNDVYIAICTYRNDNLAEAIVKDRSEKQTIVINFVNEHPDKFNKFVEDKNLHLRSFIETLITRGELIRSDFNQQISTPDGVFVGANMNEAIAWFENPKNEDIRKGLENKIKLI